MDRFDKILYDDLSLESTWIELGKGSFGKVFKGEYLGLEVAIKEVLPSGEYDVDKYFQRECKLLSESRHPNIVQYLGLCLAPGTSRRILIISEFLPNGNLRNFIHSEDEVSFRTRISICIDVARAIAYLHSRNCLHRDLKCENLLLTELNRVKVCDFGFARIAARNEEEMRRMSYCGTDGYMAPEILIGLEFGLSADIFSFGVILCEILSLNLVGGEHFKREIPSFGIDSSEIRSKASIHCPKLLIDLAIACVQVTPTSRPLIREILVSLKAIEIEILEMESRSIGINSKDRGGSWNVGTLSFSGTTKKGKKRPEAPRLPSFEGRVVVGSSILNHHGHQNYDSQGSEDDVNAIAMANVRVGRHGMGGESEDELLRGGEVGSEYSTEVIKRNDRPQAKDRLSSMESTITVKGFNGEEETKHNRSASTASSLPSLPSSWFIKPGTLEEASNDVVDENSPPIYSTQFANDPLITISRVESTSSYLTARTSSISLSGATIQDHNSPSSSEDSFDDVFHSTIKGLPSDISVDFFPTSTTSSQAATTSPHRFSLIKPTLTKLIGSLSPYNNTASIIEFNNKLITSNSTNTSNNPVKKISESNSSSKRNSVDESGGIFGNASKCGICDKRLGFMKAFLECDDCSFRCHIRCSDSAEHNCGISKLITTAPVSAHVSKLIKKRPTNNNSS